MIKGLRKSCIVFICLIMALCSVSAAVINQNGVPFVTSTHINTNGNVTNIHTDTTIKGNVGVNTFGKFDVSKGDIVNLNLINGQNKLINLIYDSSASQINGVVNSYMNGQIGGNVLFVNPKGFVIGADGVFNVGSLTLMTPTQSSMNSFVNNAFAEDSALNADQLNKLISFSFNGDNYLVCSGSTEPIKLAASPIEVSGTINADSGIDLISGGKIDIKTGAQLNANIEFQYDSENSYTFTYGTDEDITTKQLGIVKKTAPKTSVTPSSSNFAIDNGNGIVIVAANDGSESFLDAIVNLNGNVDANGSNVIVKTGATSGATSKIDMNATLSAKELTLSANNGSITSTAPAGANFEVKILNIQAYRDVNLVNDGDIVISSLSCSNANPVVEFVSRNGDINSLAQLTASKLTLYARKGDVSLSDVQVGELTVGSKTATIDNVTVQSTANLETSAKLTLGTVNVDKLIIDSDSAEITALNSGETKITTKGETKLLNTSTVTSLDLNAGSADIATLNSGVTKITTTGETKLGTVNVSDIDINAGSADVADLTSGTTIIETTGLSKLGTVNVNDLQLTAGSAEISDLITEQRARLDIADSLTITDAVVKFIYAEANTINITGSLETTSIEDASFITARTGDLELGTLTAAGNTSLTTQTGNISAGTVTSTGNATLSSAGNIDITTKLGVTGKANITATGNINATAGTIEIGTLEKLSANNADIKTLTITSTNDKTINITNALTIGTATFDSVKINATSADITNLTTTVGDATLSSTGASSIGTGDIKGALNITKSSSFTSDTKLTVEGDTNIKSSGAVELAETDMQKLTIESATAKATGLKAGDTKITTTGKTELLNTSTVKSLDLNADSADIATLNSGDTNITTTGKTKLGTAKVDVLEMTVGSTEIESLTSGVTKITADENVKLGTAMVGSIILSSGSADITTLHSLVGDANITAKTGDITLTETTVKGALTASAKNNLTISGTTSVEGKTTLKAENTLSFVPDSVTFSDLLIEEGTGTVDIKNLTITENAVINSNNNVILTNANVTGDITVNAKDMTVSGKIEVNKDSEGNKGNATINATGDVSLNQTKVANDLKIVNADNLTLNGTTDVGGKTQLKATDTLTFVPENVTFKDLTILEGTGTVDIKNLTITENAVIYSNKNVTLANADVTGNITVNANDMTVSESLVVKKGADENTGNAIINATGDVILNKTTVANDLKIVNTKNLTIKDATDVGGKTKLKATGTLTFEPDNVSFKDLEILEGTGIVNINNLTITENAVINSNTYVNIANADVTGNIVVNANDMTVSESLVVKKGTDENTGNATINATGDVILNKTKVANDLNIENTKNLTIKDVTEVEGKTRLKATGHLVFEPTDVTFEDLTILKGTGTVDINHLTITGQADINSNGKTTIKKADVTGNLTTDTWQMEVDELNVSGGNTLLRSSDLITIHNAQLDDLTTKANNMIIDDMTVEGPINTNNTGNLEVTNMLTAHDEVNMRSDASINIKDAVLDKDLYLNSKDATVLEMTLVGNLNGNVDKLKVNTTKTDELKIGYIAGESKAYAISTKITTPNTVVNGLGEEYSTKDINIYGKNITIDAAQQVASPDKQLNFKLAKNNNIWLYSDGTIDVFTTGEVGNYRKIITDNLNIKTDSSGINIFSALVSTYGDIRLKGKHIIIDNTTWAPDLYVTLQLRSITTPHYLFVNASPFIRTQPLNSLRHGINIYVNLTKDCTSMNSWLTSSMEAQLKNSNVAEKFFDKTNKTLDVWSTLDSYVANFNPDSSDSIVKTVKGEVITPANFGDMINSNPNAVKKRRRFFRRKQSMEISWLK